MRPGLWRMRTVLALLALRSASSLAVESGFSWRMEVGPAWYRYEETGAREFRGLKTEWADLAVRLVQEGRYVGPGGASGIVRFSFLTSAEDPETNNVGATPTDLRVAYFFTLQPGLQQALRLAPGLSVCPEFVWDLDWYLQVRDTRDGGEVNESVFWHGPAPGLEVRYQPPGPWEASLAYRHSFLIHVTASNSFTESLGFGDFSTDGDRDAVTLRIGYALGERWSAGLAYEFESARIDASPTRTRTVQGPGGPQTVRVQFPENDHTIHGIRFSLGYRF
jgi:hypothetical protein